MAVSSDMKAKFTLIELLVVVAIIGVLTSMLMPAIGKARRKATAAVCVSNLKNVSIGVTLYLDGNGDFFPSQGNSWDALDYYDGDNLNSTLFGNYQVPVDQILDAKEVFKCPAGRKTDPAEAFAYDYAMNAALHNYNDTFLSIGALEKPSEVLVNADTNFEWIQPNPGNRIEVRHGRNVNISWADGHVSQTSWQRLYNNAQWGHFSSNTAFSYTGDFTFLE
ncbi:MAG: prepilin-type N-terminal cleavage/methylation domain-containing protein [Lentisphaeraceae bacterium]|nr:prepilin-type N-terminal cleavage/methylation domain-containing protein [Lentisphaeraceae bacterium]